MRIRIYQLDSDKDTRRVKFENYEQTERHGGVHASEYKCVFHGDVEARDLDDVYHIFNGYNDIFHPITAEARGELGKAIVAAYNQELATEQTTEQTEAPAQAMQQM